MFARILVATDFSKPADGAWAQARELAGAFHATVHLLHVLPNLFLRPVVNDPHDLETATLKQLRDRLTDADQRRFRSVAAVERSDDPADVIVSYARTHDIDLIVMGTHGRVGVAHVLMGSVAETVMRTAPCPVLTVRATGPATAVRLAHILVPTDFSPPSDAALDMARLVAERFGASLHLLHVLEDRLVDHAFGSELLHSESPEKRAARLADAQEQLSHRISADDRARLHATTEIVFGPSARTIVDYAVNNSADLIVMGTHGRPRIAHLLMGSVAEQVVRHATCPVSTVRDARVRARHRLPVEAHAAVIA
ncbi:MAG TPA: universal stress protein [Vicinamibacterales bacterium]